MATERTSYRAGGNTFIGALVYGETTEDKRSLMLVAPNWLGVSDDAIERPRMMVGSRYIGFVADVYGNGKVSDGPRRSPMRCAPIRKSAGCALRLPRRRSWRKRKSRNWRHVTESRGRLLLLRRQRAGTGQPLGMICPQRTMVAGR